MKKSSMKFAYYSIEQTKQFAFYQIPKALFSGIFRSLSNDERILYAMMRDRLSLSLKNRWLDDDGHVYIIYTLEEMIEDLGASKNTITKLVTDLEKFGLIERKKRGQGLPALIFVMDFASPIDENSDSQNLGVKKPKNRESRIPETELQDSQDLGATKTNKSKTDRSNNNTSADAAGSVVVKSVKSIVKEDITDAEALAIAKVAGYNTAAGYDESSVRTAYQSAGKDVQNVVGYMIAALRDGYRPPVKKTKKDPYRDGVIERHTDYEALFGDGN